MPRCPEDEIRAKTIRLAFPSGASEVRAALSQLREKLAEMALSDTDEDTAELVLGEVLNNVVEHAYGGGRAGEIRMRCRLLQNGLAFCVCDSGRQMPGLRLPSGEPPDLACPRADLPEGGFGWFLVASQTTGLAYARRRGHNFLRFFIPFSGGPVSQPSVDTGG